MICISKRAISDFQTGSGRWSTKGDTNVAVIALLVQKSSRAQSNDKLSTVDAWVLRPKLHYADTGYEHRLRTPATNTTNGQVVDVVQHVRSRLNLLYNILPATDTTNGRAHNNSTTCCTTKSPPTNKNLPHPNILTCREMLGSGIAMWQICCGIVVSFFVVSLGGVVHVRRQCPCWADVVQANFTGYGHVVQHLQLVVSTVAGVRSRCPCSGVCALRNLSHARASTFLYSTTAALTNRCILLRQLNKLSPSSSYFK